MSDFDGEIPGALTAQNLDTLGMSLHLTLIDLEDLLERRGYEASQPDLYYPTVKEDLIAIETLQGYLEAAREQVKIFLSKSIDL